MLNIRQFAITSTSTEPPRPSPPLKEANGTREAVRAGSTPHTCG